MNQEKNEVSDASMALPLHRDVIVAEGPDVVGFLQGQLTQDVAEMAVDSSRWSLLLQPQGKVVAWLRVNREATERFSLDLDAGYANDVVARLNRFLLRTKVTFVVVPGAEAFGWSLRGLSADDSGHGWEPPADAYLDARIALGDAFVRDVMTTTEWMPPVGFTVGSGVSFEQARIVAGVPAMGHELTADVIPAELGQWLIDASVSFTKGCYTGQELVARIDSRGGNVPRHLRRVEIDGDELLPEDGLITVADLGEVGALTSSVVSPDGLHTWGLAFVKRAVSGADVVGSLSDGRQVLIH